MHARSLPSPTFLAGMPPHLAFPLGSGEGTRVLLFTRQAIHRASERAVRPAPELGCLCCRPSSRHTHCCSTSTLSCHRSATLGVTANFVLVLLSGSLVLSKGSSVTMLLLTHTELSPVPGQRAVGTRLLTLLTRHSRQGRLWKDSHSCCCWAGPLNIRAPRVLSGAPSGPCQLGSIG